jgi:predicted Fe-Mo cluster-binding NifX family protein
MRIAVTAQEKSETAMVDSRFGRAACFMVHDTEKGSWHAHDNSQNLRAAQGAGVQAAQQIVGLDVDTVITGNVGPKAWRVLSAAAIRVMLTEKTTVQDAFSALEEGKLKEAEDANVEGHWM